MAIVAAGTFTNAVRALGRPRAAAATAGSGLAGVRIRERGRYGTAAADTTASASRQIGVNRAGAATTGTLAIGVWIKRLPPLFLEGDTGTTGALEGDTAAGVFEGVTLTVQAEARTAGSGFEGRTLVGAGVGT